MQRSENAFLLGFVLLTFMACKTTAINPRQIEDTAQEISTEAQSITQTADAIIQRLEAEPVQVEQVKADVTAIKKSAEKIETLNQRQAENLITITDQYNREIDEARDTSAKLTAEVKAVTAERDRAIDKYKPWKKTAIVFILLFIGILLLTIARIVIKYFIA